MVNARFYRAGNYPLHEVGRLTLDPNPTDFHTEIEQAAFEYWRSIDKEIGDRIAKGVNGD